MRILEVAIEYIHLLTKNYYNYFYTTQMKTVNRGENMVKRVRMKVKRGGMMLWKKMEKTR